MYFQLCYNAYDSCCAGWTWIPLLLPPFAYIPLTASTPLTKGDTHKNIPSLFSGITKDGVLLKISHNPVKICIFLT